MHSLVCAEDTAPSDALLLENFDAVIHPVFERARQLRKAGVAQRVLVRTAVEPRHRRTECRRAWHGVELMARPPDSGRTPYRAHAYAHRAAPSRSNAAYGIRDFLEREGLRL